MMVGLTSALQPGLALTLAKNVPSLPVLPVFQS